MDDDADRGKAHDQRRDDRREDQPEGRIEHAGGDRHAKRVVQKIEQQVLAYATHRGDRQFESAGFDAA